MAVYPPTHSQESERGMMPKCEAILMASNGKNTRKPEAAAKLIPMSKARIVSINLILNNYSVNVL